MIYKEEYLLKNVRISSIKKTINNYFLEHKKKSTRFKFDFRIDSILEKFNKNNKVILNITFYSDKKDVAQNYFFKCPKPMIENQMLKILDRNLLVIKSLGDYLDPNPLIDYIIYKYWGRIDNIKNKKVLIHHRNWYEFTPHHPSQKLLELMRSY